MSTRSDLVPDGTPPANDPEAIRQEIERTREDLAETVDALHAKLDVKSQAKARITRTKERLTSGGGTPRPEMVAGVLGAVLLVAGLIRWRRS